MSISTTGAAAAAWIGKGNSSAHARSPELSETHSNGNLPVSDRPGTVMLSHANADQEIQMQIGSGQLTDVEKLPAGYVQNHPIQDGGGNQSVKTKGSGDQGPKATGSKGQVSKGPSPKVKVKEVRLQARPVGPPTVSGLKRKTRASVNSGDRSSAFELPLSDARRIMKERRKKSSADQPYPKPTRAGSEQPRGSHIEPLSSQSEDELQAQPEPTVRPPVAFIPDPFARRSLMTRTPVQLMDADVPSAAVGDAGALGDQQAGDEETLFSPTVNDHHLMEVERNARRVSQANQPVAEQAKEKPKGIGPNGARVTIRLSRGPTGAIDTEALTGFYNRGVAEVNEDTRDFVLHASLRPEPAAQPTVSPILDGPNEMEGAHIMAGVQVNSTPTLGGFTLGNAQVVETPKPVNAIDVDQLGDLLDHLEQERSRQEGAERLAAEESQRRREAEPGLLLSPIDGPTAAPTGAVDSDLDDSAILPAGLWNERESADSALGNDDEQTGAELSESPEGIEATPPARPAAKPPSKPRQLQTTDKRSSRPSTVEQQPTARLKEGRNFDDIGWKNTVYMVAPGQVKESVHFWLRKGTEQKPVATLFIGANRWAEIFLTPEDRRNEGIDDAVAAILPDDCPDFAGYSVRPLLGTADMGIYMEGGWQVRVKVVSQRKLAEVRRPSPQLSRIENESGNERRRDRSVSSRRTSTAHGNTLQQHAGATPGARGELRRTKSQHPDQMSSRREASRVKDERRRSRVATPKSPERRERYDPKYNSPDPPTPGLARAGLKAYNDYRKQVKINRDRKGHTRERESQRRSRKPERRRRPSSQSSSQSSASDSSRSDSSRSDTPRDRLYPGRKVVRKVRDYERRVGSRDSPGAGTQLERTMRELADHMKHSRPGRMMGNSKPHGIQSYNGSVTGEVGDIPSFRVWADRYRIKWNGMGVKSDADLVDRLPLSLEGTALDEFQTLTRDEKETFEACVEAMVERLEPGKNNSAEARLRLNDRVQEEGETVSHYLRTLRAMVKRAHPRVGKSGAEDILLNVFVAGLRDAIRLDVAKAEPTRVKYALEEALVVEKALNRYNRKKTVAKVRACSPGSSLGSSAVGFDYSVCAAYGNPGQNQGWRKEQSAPSTVSVPPSYDTRSQEQRAQHPNGCWGCGQEGHRRNECKSNPFPPRQPRQRWGNRQQQPNGNNQGQQQQWPDGSNQNNQSGQPPVLTGGNAQQLNPSMSKGQTNSNGSSTVGSSSGIGSDTSAPPNNTGPGGPLNQNSQFMIYSGGLDCTSPLQPSRVGPTPPNMPEPPLGGGEEEAEGVDDDSSTLTMNEIMSVAGEKGDSFTPGEIQRIIIIAQTFSEYSLESARAAYEGSRRDAWGRIKAFPVMMSDSCEETLDRRLGLRNLKRYHRASMIGLAAARVFEKYRRRYRRLIEQRQTVATAIPGLVHVGENEYATSISQFEHDCYLRTSPEAKTARSRLPKGTKPLPVGRSYDVSGPDVVTYRRSPLIAVVHYKTSDESVEEYIRQFKVFTEAILGPDRSPMTDSETVSAAAAKCLPPAFVAGRVEDVETLFMLDTGASISMMSKDFRDEFFPNVKLRPAPPESIAFCINGNKIEVEGVVELTVWIGGYPTPVEFNVSQHNGYEALLGREWWNNAGEVTMACGPGYVTIEPWKQSWQISRPPKVQVAMWPKPKSFVYGGHAEEETLIPPHTLQYVSVVSTGQYMVKGDCWFEPSNQFTDYTGLIPQRIVCSIGGPDVSSKAWVPVMNFTKDVITIAKGSVMGRFEQTDAIIGGSPEPYSREEKQIYRNATRPHVGTIRTADGTIVVDGKDSGVTEVYTLPLGVELDPSLTVEQQYLLARLLHEKFQAFSAGDWDMGRCNRLEFEIDTGDAKAIRTQPRRLAFAHKKRVEEYLHEALKNKLIEPSRSPWSHNLVVVKKKGGPDRVCVDYRPVNSVTKPDAFPLPRIDDTIDRLSGCGRFSALDFKSCYNQIELAPSAKEKTAFAVEGGLFQYNRLPFGLRNAPAACQRLMEELMAGLNWSIMLIYIDDIIVFSKTFEENISRLALVLDRVIESGLKLSGKKCQFCREEILFLGHIIGKDGVRPDPANIKKLLDIKAPKNRTEVYAFLGLANYYRPFGGKEYARVAEPLSRLCRKENPFIWDAAANEAFETIKAKLSSPSVVQSFPDFGKPFFIVTDASQHAVGAVLEQIGPDGKRKWIAAASRMLTPAERKFFTVDREALAAAFGVEKFEPIVYGHDITIETDHKPLETWHTKRETRNVTMHQLWHTLMCQYKLKIVYIPGKSNPVADFLSRPTDPDQQDGFGYYDVDAAAREYIDAGISEDEIDQLQEADKRDGGGLAGMFERSYNEEMRTEERIVARARRLREKREKSDKEAEERASTIDEDGGEPEPTEEGNDDPLAVLPFEQRGDPGSYAAHLIQHVYAVGNEPNQLVPDIIVVPPGDVPTASAPSKTAGVRQQKAARKAETIAKMVERVAGGRERLDETVDMTGEEGEEIHHDDGPHVYHLPSFIQTARVGAIMTRSQIRQIEKDALIASRMGDLSESDTEPTEMPTEVADEKTKAPRKKKQPKAQLDPKWTCPICRTLCTPEELAVICDNCDFWQHYKCAEVTSEELEKIGDWYCAKCSALDSVKDQKEFDSISLPDGLMDVSVATDYQPEDGASRDVSILTPPQVAAEEICVSGPLELNGEWPKERILELQKEDSFFGPILSYLETGSVPQDEKTAARVDRQSEAYDVVDELLFHNAIEMTLRRPAELRQQLCAPKPMRKHLLHAAHDSKLGGGHLGVEKVYPKISSHFFWPRMITTVKEYIATCKDCQERKGPGRIQVAPLKSIPVGKVGARWEVDLMGPLKLSSRKNMYVCVFIDTYSKWVVAKAIKNKTAETVARVFLRKIFCVFGAPKELQSDLGTEFTAAVVKEVCRMVGCQKVYSTAYRPTSQGMVERFNKTLAGIIAMYIDSKHQRWDEELPYAVFAYNTAKQASTGVTPFFAMYCREARWTVLNDFECNNAIGWTAQSFLDDNLATIKAATELVEDNIKRAQERQKFYHDRSKGLLKPLYVGQKVLCNSPVLGAEESRKFGRHWHGPFEIVRTYGTLNYTIRRCDEDGDESEVHRERLVKYRERDEAAMFGERQYIGGDPVDLVNVHPVIPTAVYWPGDVSERIGDVDPPGTLADAARADRASKETEVQFDANGGIVGMILPGINMYSALHYYHSRSETVRNRNEGTTVRVPIRTWDIPGGEPLYNQPIDGSTQGRSWPVDSKEKYKDGEDFMNWTERIELYLSHDNGPFEYVSAAVVADYLSPTAAEVYQRNFCQAYEDDWEWYRTEMHLHLGGKDLPTEHYPNAYNWSEPNVTDVHPLILLRRLWKRTNQFSRQARRTTERIWRHWAGSGWHNDGGFNPPPPMERFSGALTVVDAMNVGLSEEAKLSPVDVCYRCGLNFWITALQDGIAADDKYSRLLIREISRQWNSQPCCNRTVGKPAGPVTSNIDPPGSASLVGAVIMGSGGDEPPRRPRQQSEQHRQSGNTNRSTDSRQNSGQQPDAQPSRLPWHSRPVPNPPPRRAPVVLVPEGTVLRETASVTDWRQRSSAEAAERRRTTTIPAPAVHRIRSWRDVDASRPGMSGAEFMQDFRRHFGLAAETPSNTVASEIQRAMETSAFSSASDDQEEMSSGGETEAPELGGTRPSVVETEDASVARWHRENEGVSEGTHQHYDSLTPAEREEYYPLRMGSTGDQPRIARLSRLEREVPELANLRRSTRESIRDTVRGVWDRVAHGRTPQQFFPSTDPRSEYSVERLVDRWTNQREILHHLGMRCGCDEENRSGTCRCTEEYWEDADTSDVADRNERTGRVQHEPQQGRTSPRCWGCGLEGHRRRECQSNPFPGRRGGIAMNRVSSAVVSGAPTTTAWIEEGGVRRPLAFTMTIRTDSEGRSETDRTGRFPLPRIGSDAARIPVPRIDNGWRISRTGEPTRLVTDPEELDGLNGDVDIGHCTCDLRGYNSLCTFCRNCSAQQANRCTCGANVDWPEACLFCRNDERGSPWRSDSITGGSYRRVNRSRGTDSRRGRGRGIGARRPPTGASQRRGSRQLSPRRFGGRPDPPGVDTFEQRFAAYQRGPSQHRGPGRFGEPPGTPDGFQEEWDIAHEARERAGRTNRCDCIPEFNGVCCDICRGHPDEDEIGSETDEPRQHRPGSQYPNVTRIHRTNGCDCIPEADGVCWHNCGGRSAEDAVGRDEPIERRPRSQYPDMTRSSTQMRTGTRRNQRRSGANDCRGGRTDASRSRWEPRGDQSRSRSASLSRGRTSPTPDFRGVYRGLPLWARSTAGHEEAVRRYGEDLAALYWDTPGHLHGNAIWEYLDARVQRVRERRTTPTAYRQRDSPPARSLIPGGPDERDVTNARYLEEFTEAVDRYGTELADNYWRIPAGLHGEAQWEYLDQMVQRVRAGMQAETLRVTNNGRTGWRQWIDEYGRRVRHFLGESDLMLTGFNQVGLALEAPPDGNVQIPPPTADGDGSLAVEPNNSEDPSDDEEMETQENVALPDGDLRERPSDSDSDGEGGDSRPIQSAAGKNPASAGVQNPGSESKETPKGNAPPVTQRSRRFNVFPPEGRSFEWSEEPETQVWSRPTVARMPLTPAQVLARDEDAAESDAENRDDWVSRNVLRHVLEPYDGQEDFNLFLDRMILSFYARMALNLPLTPSLYGRLFGGRPEIRAAFRSLSVADVSNWERFRTAMGAKMLAEERCLCRWDERDPLGLAPMIVALELRCHLNLFSKCQRSALDTIISRLEPWGYNPEAIQPGQVGVRLELEETADEEHFEGEPLHIYNNGLPTVAVFTRLEMDFAKDDIRGSQLIWALKFLMSKRVRESRPDLFGTEEIKIWGEQKDRRVALANSPTPHHYQLDAWEIWTGRNILGSIRSRSPGELLDRLMDRIPSQSKAAGTVGHQLYDHLRTRWEVPEKDSKRIYWTASQVQPSTVAQWAIAPVPDREKKKLTGWRCQDKSVKEKPAERMTEFLDTGDEDLSEEWAKWSARVEQIRKETNGRESTVGGAIGDWLNPRTYRIWRRLEDFHNDWPQLRKLVGAALGSFSYVSTVGQFRMAQEKEIDDSISADVDAAGMEFSGSPRLIRRLEGLLPEGDVEGRKIADALVERFLLDGAHREKFSAVF